ncbi:MAG: hypothetical protein RL173_2325 [Fibrobacterota bacterium]|jgi:hypothetical protein
MTSRPDLAGLVADLASAQALKIPEIGTDEIAMIDGAFDGHLTRNFADMTAEERLDDLSRKIALVLELRKSRLGQIADRPAAQA